MFGEEVGAGSEELGVGVLFYLTEERIGLRQGVGTRVIPGCRDLAIWGWKENRGPGIWKVVFALLRGLW
jgi:hypothetical protein